tara:strand:- start:19551 stop:21095 length:1545 start_codon:yes stop_codon:yes gene_type:complete
MKMDDKLIQWLNSENDVHSEYAKKKFYDQIIFDNPKIKKDYLINEIDKIKQIVKIFSKKPWVTQKEISEKLNLEKPQLLKINEIISETDLLQSLILKNGYAKKYWNSIIPFSNLTEKALNNEYSFPKRIALFPGVSCMFYCGFCGRNQNAKYPLNIIDDSLEMYKKLFDESPNYTSYSVSGGLEPLTNPKLGELVNYAKLKGINLPIITNGYSLTDGFLAKNPGIWNADSLRISLYGIDDESYEFITRVKKSFKLVYRNSISFLKKRNEKNKSMKFGFNFIILPENLHQLLEIPNLIKSINENVENGEGVNFLTLRDDYQSVTEHSTDRDTERKYRLNKSMNFDERKKLQDNIFKFEELREKMCPNLFVDYGYSLETLFKGQVDTGLIKVNGKDMRKFGFTQISVAIDLYGDVFLFREAGFLNRKGNEKMIIGRISKDKSLEEIIKKFLHENKPLHFENDDSRFMDSFDHVLTSLVNQAEKDNEFEIPFKFGPIKLRKQNNKMRIGNNWYSNIT